MKLKLNPVKVSQMFDLEDIAGDIIDTKVANFTRAYLKKNFGISIEI